MRKIVNVQSCLFFNVEKDKTLIKEYHDKYDKISDNLDSNPVLLNKVHEDLQHYGSANGKGSTFSSEQIFRMLIVMFTEQLPYRDTIIRVSESAFLRNFTRIGIGKIMSHSFLCSAYKQINPATWLVVNDHLTNIALQNEKISGEKLRLDSTVCESNIHFPTDAFLLWDTYRVIARIIRQSNESEPIWSMGNRFHDKKIKKLYTYISTHSSKKNKSVKRNVIRKLKLLIERVATICYVAEMYIARNRFIPPSNLISIGYLEKLKHFSTLGISVVDQSYRIHIQKETVPATEKIFSIFEEHTELLKRGKAGKTTEFGHMVSIGQTREKFISYYDVGEKSLHDKEIKKIALEDHKQKFSGYPKAFTADKNYYENMEEIYSLEEKMELCAIGKKGNKNASESARESSDAFKAMQRFRAGVEGSISVLKRVFGLRRCFFKGFKSFASAVGCLVFCHNMVLLTRL